MAITIDGSNGITTPDLDSTGPVTATTGTFSGAVQASGVATNLYPLVLRTAVSNPTSPASTSIDFTNIPSWVERITVIFNGLSLSGTSDILVQIGDSGGFETTGYLSSCSATGSGTAVSSSTAGMVIRSAAAASITSGAMFLINIGSNTWVSSYSGKQSSSAASAGGGDKTLSDTLTQVRITTVNGTDTFDAGTVNILYE